MTDDQRHFDGVGGDPTSPGFQGDSGPQAGGQCPAGSPGVQPTGDQQSYGSPDQGQQPQQQPYGAAGYGQAFPGGPGANTLHTETPTPRPGPVSIGDTLGNAWRLFTGNLVPWIVFTLIYLAISGVVSLVINSAEPGSSTAAMLALVGSVVSFVVGTAFSVMMIRAALAEVDGRKPELGEFFTVPAFGMALLANLLMLIAVLVGLIGVIIGALVVAFFLYWTLYFVVDKNLSAVDALTASAKSIASQGGVLFGLAVVNTLILFGGALLLGVGLLVAYPVTLLASAWAFRVVTGAGVDSGTAVPAQNYGY